MDYVSKLKADILLLQETHLLQSEEKCLSDSNYSIIFSSCYNSRQRGVSILVHKRIPFTLNSTVTDSEGRYIIIQATIFNKLYSIVNLYAPNNEDPAFFHTVFSHLADLSANSITIIGGDFNIVLNPSVDRSNSPIHVKQSQSVKVIHDYMKDFGLDDVWRLKNPTKRDYTFFSPVHKTFSRIDFFLLNNSIAHKVTTKIHPIIISDHAPISLSLQTDSIPKPPQTWRLNISLLKDPEFDRVIRSEWADFLKNNDSNDLSPSLLWETGKAVIRGKIISYSSYKKKKDLQTEKEIEEKIKQLTENYAINPSDQLWSELQNAKLNLDNILSKKTEFLLQQLRYNDFEHNNKSGKFLANQLQRNKEKSFITAIQDPSGKYTQSPQEINQTFYNYYQSLYSAAVNPNIEDIHNFLNNLNMPELTSNYRDILDAPLTMKELQCALDSMPAGKAPGPDGFPAEFLKHFWSMLAPLFFRTVTEIKNNGYISPHMNTAAIKLLLKPDKDPTLPSSYRPLSLINTDIKIISKALASRLEKIIPSIIHSDQTGFINGRHSTNNIRRLLNLISLTQRHNKEAIVMSLDAEKAFDKVNWSFLFAVLHKFGFGESFIQWVSALYNSPKATVTTNGITSQSFSLQRGTRQGCPLSPLLFAIFIEPLATAVRQNTDIKGICALESEHKINLYADDILLYLQEPKTSVKEVFNLITTFSRLSDYSVNWSKSIILPLTENSWKPAAQNSHYSFPTGNIRYLGINISSKLSELVHLNFTPLLDKVCDDLRRWNNLPISLLGRIATVKMKILPKINYLFSMIPFKPTSKWFQSLDSAIGKFYSKNKKAKIRLTTLQKNKSEGGLEAPNFMYYYLSNQIQYLTKWIHPHEEYNSWLELEQLDCNQIKISDLPFITSALKHHSCFKNPMIASTLSAWWKALETTGSQLKPSILSPIWHNPDFANNKIALYFSTWAERGVTHLHHLLDDNTFRTYINLFQTFEIRNGNFLQYLQVKKTITSRIPSLQTTLQPTDLQPPEFVDYIVKLSPRNKKNLSKIYGLLSKTHSIHLPTQKWEKDVSKSFDSDFWTQICENTFKMTKNTNLQLIQFKVLHRTHITQYKLYKMGFSRSDTCTQCTQNMTDTYFHALWLCTPVYQFWVTITQKLSNILDCGIPHSPNVCLIGDLTQTALPDIHIQPTLAAIAIAKKTILVNWKDKKALNITHWLNLLTEHISLERISAIRKNQLDSFKEKWSPFIKSININLYGAAWSSLRGGVLHAAGPWWGCGAYRGAALALRLLGVSVLAGPVGFVWAHLGLLPLGSGGPLHQYRWSYYLSPPLLSPHGPDPHQTASYCALHTLHTSLYIVSLRHI
uniref:Reverse transcriptase domain-containing protein n=1 Tax=Amphiprion ocellaris TaxID=80972 RepID=A0A3Q1CLT5_AMPOC